MANEEKLQALAARLASATRSGSLRWTASEDGRFELSLPSGAIIVEQNPDGFLAMHVYDDRANHVESLEQTETSAPWDRVLHALWEAARNSGLNIDELLDSILRDVESASREPLDDDNRL
jgi:hypothetical protein